MRKAVWKGWECGSGADVEAFGETGVNHALIFINPEKIKNQIKGAHRKFEQTNY